MSFEYNGRTRQPELPEPRQAPPRGQISVRQISPIFVAARWGSVHHIEQRSTFARHFRRKTREVSCPTL